MITVLFTSSKTLGSWLIRKLTGEPFSHVAIYFSCLNYDFVLHATMSKVEIIPFRKFVEKNYIHESIPLERQLSPIELETYVKKPYDYFALFWLALCFLVRYRPSRNNWAVRRAFTCTELVTELLYGKADSVITPYRLWLKLKKERILK